MKNIFIKFCLCIGVWFGSVCSASAALIIDTGEPPSPDFGSALVGPSNGYYQYQAGKIALSSPYRINSIDTYLKFNAPYFANGGAFSIALYNDSASGPGSLAYSATGGYM